MGHGGSSRGKSDIYRENEQAMFLRERDYRPSFETHLF